jgi:hypothetical protein
MPATFGRRVSPQANAPRAKIVREPVVPEAKSPAPFTFESATAPPAGALSLEDELREWKHNRASGFHIPWRQISLMATLCFGIASFVLPDSTNDVVNWLLYALMAISFVVGISRRRKRADAARPV